MLTEVEQVDGPWQIEVERAGLSLSATLGNGDLNLSGLELNGPRGPLLIGPSARLLPHIVLVHAACEEYIFIMNTITIFTALFGGLGIPIKCLFQKQK